MSARTSLAYHPPVDKGLDFIFLNNDFVVVAKPSGLLAVPGRGDEKADCLSARVQRRLPQAIIVHRLDMQTSGLFIMALHRDAQATLGKLFAQRAINKHYHAVVAGRLAQQTGSIALPLRADWDNRPQQVVDPLAGKPATTCYQRLHVDEYRQISMVQLQPHTGRSHQLRVHMQAIGHPILGDQLYAPTHIASAAGRLLLHASRLEFHYPGYRKICTFQCPIPADFTYID